MIIKKPIISLKRKIPDILEWLVNPDDGLTSFGSSKKIDFKCTDCQSIFTTSANKFSAGNRCPFCSGRKVNETNWAYANNIMRESSCDPDGLKTVTAWSNKKHMWFCKKCDSEYVAGINMFNAGTRCSYCSGQKVNETNWAFSQEEMVKCSVDVNILKTVTPQSHKYNYWKCQKCSETYYCKFSDFYKGQRCPYCCSSPRRVNSSNWAESNSDMCRLSKDKNILKLVTPSSNKKNTWVCDRCDSEYISSFATFNSGVRCPYCCSAPQKVNHTNWAYNNNDMVKASKDKEILKTFTPFSESKNCWVCEKCESEYFSAIKDFNAGCRCPYCTGKAVNSTNWAYANKDMYNASKDKNVLKTVSCGSSLKNVWICPNCENDYTSSFYTFSRGHRCPACKASKGENKIKEFLEKTNIAYCAQYRISGCKSIRPLPFDYALLDADKIVGLIEYQGRQHYEEIPYWGGKNKLIECQTRDKIKEAYCCANNLPLLVIPYTEEKNINSVLYAFIEKIKIPYKLIPWIDNIG